MNNKNFAGKPLALVIIRTPFQAWLAQKVLVEEDIKNYDLLYFTQNDSAEDKYYFSALKSTARESFYFFATPKKHDIISHLSFRWVARHWCSDRGYNKVFFASINAHVPNAVASAQANAQLITFDDGAANIFTHGEYHNEPPSLRVKVYRALLGAKSLASTKKRIVKHYTVYKNFENIIDQGRLRFVGGWSKKNLRVEGLGYKKYFIGAPFHEVMNDEQIARLEVYLKNENIDFYVRHPREIKPLDIGAEFLNKKGRIAEDAILEDAGGNRIELVGYLSSVMFNLSSLSTNKTVLIPHEKIGLFELSENAVSCGCKVVNI